MKDSSFIKEVVWKNNKLFVRLTSGRFYEYENVSEQVYQDFINAESLGKFFGGHIKDVYDYTPFVEPEEKVAPPMDFSSPDRWPFPTSNKP